MEIELKLALQPRHTARLRRHPVLHKIKPEQRLLYSIYFDTPKFDLMRRGIALRVRRVGDQWIQTLKAEAHSVGALSSRPEWEVPVTDGNRPDFSVLPHDALDLLDGIKHKYIAPVFITEFERTTWQVGNNGTQAEVALDTGKIYAGAAYRDICEVEIELKSGVPVFLFDVATRLLEQVPLQVEPRSKAERGYILSGAVNPAPIRAIHPVIHGNQTPGEVWRAIMQAALVQLVSNVPGFLENAQHIEYLHQLRIALRRLQTGVKLAKSLGQALPDWDQPLGGAIYALNSARDWDVFLNDTWPDIFGVLGESAADEPIEDAVPVLMNDVAAQARQRAQALLRQPAFTQLVLDIGRSLLTPPVGVPDRNTMAWAGMILDKRWHILRQRCHGFAGLNAAQRHRARIAAKKMRYAAEALAPLYSNKRSHRFITALAALQNELGCANDVRVGTQLLRAVPKKTILLGYDLGRIHGALEYKAVRHIGLSDAIWRRLARSRLFWR